MKQTIIHVDAFTNQVFRGNPAAVCILESPQSDEWMQLVAREMNLSETAFVIEQPDAYQLRWFTPTTEVPLCGHATLASAHVLWTEGYVGRDRSIAFQTQSGLLTASFQDGWIELDFPVNLSQPTETPAKLITVLGVPVKTTLINSLGYLVEVDSADIVTNLQPNFSLLKTLATNNIIVTSVANFDTEYDFVSRFFAPGLGIDEDPVTGAAHCCLAPVWRDRLKKDELLAYQASRRGGTIKIKYSGGDRVLLQGQAVTVMHGQLF
ncbi:MAG: PhzF family phenazine biosynthesis protein [Pleurocapsa sp.]